MRRSPGSKTPFLGRFPANLSAWRLHIPRKLLAGEDFHTPNSHNFRLYALDFACL
jgi:hypothetical protein